MAGHALLQARTDISSRVYALDRQLELKAGAGRKELESEMIGHIIAEGELMGKYGKT